MFSSLESFSVFFFTCLILIILGIVFEEKLIEVERKFDRWCRNRKYQKALATAKTNKKIK